ncbi:hypothetical protein HPP92_010823 [Vanilla planifolia]|uniref:DUF1295 domain-containing protein n=1 Tax=Vanilla planifolia TaxID=51239 RepID=A0A835V0G4_VANPL|nr:hypothetical protein HPP92_011083 [Vanilla planifolia]KAG0482739.1 hypothetical protein HPP92_010823 [Vanilla planifolia]
MNKNGTKWIFSQVACMFTSSREGFLYAVNPFDDVFADYPDITRFGMGSSLEFISVAEALWVWTVSLPLTIENASDRDPSIKLQDLIGWVMLLMGIIVEPIADQQKLRFKSSPINQGKWCNIGIWKYSRHPNYFGEPSDFTATCCIWEFACMAQDDFSFLVSLVQQATKQGKIRAEESQLFSSKLLACSYLYTFVFG